MKISFPMDPELKQAVHEAAAAMGIDDAEWIRQAVSEKTAREGKIVTDPAWVRQALMERLGRSEPESRQAPQSSGGGRMSQIGRELSAAFKSPPLRELAANLGASLKGNNINGLYQGLPFSCHYSPGGRNTPPTFDIFLQAAFPETISFRKENAADGFSKRIGLSSEVQSGDSVFDSKFYIDSDNPDFARAFAADEYKRRAVETVFAVSGNISLLTLSPKFLKIHVVPCRSNSSVLTQPAVSNILAVLSGLAKSAPAVPATPFSLFAAKDSYKTVRTFFLTVAGASLAAGMIFLFTGVLHYAPILSGEFKLFSPSLRYSLSALALFLFSAFQLMKGRSSSGRLFLWLLLMSAPGFVLTSWGGLISSNGFLDKGKQDVRVLPVIEKSVYHGKSDSYYIDLPSWRSDAPKITMNVNSGFYNSLNKGDKVELTTKPGRWHIEWKVSLRKLQPD
jgi:hypothetical protein